MHARQFAGSLLRALLAVPWAYAWMIPITIALRMGPSVAAAVIVATATAFLARNVARPLRSRPRLAARFRLRPCGRYLPLLTLAVGAKLLLMVSGFAIHEEIAARRLLPRLPDNPEIVSPAFLAHPLGAVALFVAIAVLAPLIEEFAFRGKMQRALEPTLGLTAAILIPAAIFSVLHGWVDAIHHIPFAIFAGWAVWRTGSIWTAVYMHALNNVVGGLALYLPDSSGVTTDELPSWLWQLAIGGGVVALGGLVAIGARIHQLANTDRPRARAWPLGPSVQAAVAAAARG